MHIALQNRRVICACVIRNMLCAGATTAVRMILITFAIPSSLSPPKKSLIPASVVLTQYSSLVDRYIIVLNHSCILDFHLPSTSCKPRANEMLCHAQHLAGHGNSCTHSTTNTPMSSLNSRGTPITSDSILQLCSSSDLSEKSTPVLTGGWRLTKLL